MNELKRELRRLEDLMADVYESKSAKSVKDLHRRIEILKREIKRRENA